ncbi:unnamed protein product [Amoebophrya sp. A25]|nr:unnamed protein product [Amoebophrya sp. A25]|eukprot:GSA25T00014263001.1
MVIPMPAGMGAAMSGDPPEAIQGHLQKIKWTIVAVFVGSVGKLVQGAMPFNELFYVLSGIFLMKDDKITGKAYKCLLGTPIGACAGPSGGGLSCLTPVMFLGALNILFGLFSPYLMEPFNLVCLVAQAIGCYFGYQAWQYLRGEAGPTGAGALPGGLQGHTTYNPPAPETRSGTMASLASATNPTTPQTGFVAFQGEGNKLGNT